MMSSRVGSGRKALRMKSEIESIFEAQLDKTIESCQNLKIYTVLSRTEPSEYVWEKLIEHYETLKVIQLKLSSMSGSLEWELMRKKDWETKNKKKFDPALECGDG